VKASRPGSELVSSQADRVRDAFGMIDAGRPPQGAEIKIGLVGRGIAASLTPIMHETEGRRLGLAYRYDLIDFDSLGLEDTDLEPVLHWAQANGYDGLNVTFPFKQAIIPYLATLAPEAAAIGAVNTVVLRGGGRNGHNTDCWGFAQSVRAGLGNVALGRVVQIGAGGAGAAVAHALVQLGAEQIEIVDADLQKAEALAQRVTDMTGIKARPWPTYAVEDVLPGADGVVNATPVGMEKLPGLPVAPQLLNATQWVADIIYFPRQTEFLRQARAMGCAVLPGGGMAINQAVRAFALFTDMEPDGGEMGKTFATYA